MLAKRRVRSLARDNTLNHKEDSASSGRKRISGKQAFIRSKLEEVQTFKPCSVAEKGRQGLKKGQKDKKKVQ